MTAFITSPAAVASSGTPSLLALPVSDEAALVSLLTDYRLRSHSGRLATSEIAGIVVSFGLSCCTDNECPIVSTRPLLHEF